MVFLQRERASLQRWLPGLDRELSALPFELLESKDNPGIELFRQAGGAGLVVPSSLGGSGANRLELVRVMRALATRTPSTALGMTMHLVSTASFCSALKREPAAADLLRAIVDNRWLVASAHAEGKSGQAFNRPQLVARAVEGGYRVTGTKKPCSLARSMDILTILFAIPGAETSHAEGTPCYRRAHAVLAASTEGISVEPFWRSPVLAGAQSEAVVLRDVFVPSELVSVPEDEAAFSHEETDGFVWFLLLACASYIGCCSALVERCVVRDRVPAQQRVALASELDGAMLAIEALARRSDEGEDCGAVFAEALAQRYAIQRTLARVAPEAAQSLGGVAFVESCEVAHLLAASQGLSFHPPQQSTMIEALAARYEGKASSFF